MSKSELSIVVSVALNQAKKHLEKETKQLILQLNLINSALATASFNGQNAYWAYEGGRFVLQGQFLKKGDVIVIRSFGPSWLLYYPKQEPRRFSRIVDAFQNVTRYLENNYDVVGKAKYLSDSNR